MPLCLVADNQVRHSPHHNEETSQRRSFRFITECIEMLSKIIVSVAAVAATSVCWADGTCDLALMQQYRDCAHIVGSLRPEKAGQARVFAYDGSEYTGGQAAWGGGLGGFGRGLLPAPQPDTYASWGVQVRLR